MEFYYENMKITKNGYGVKLYPNYSCTQGKKDLKVPNAYLLVIMKRLKGKYYVIL